MRPFNGPVLAFIVCLCLKTGFAYVEALAAHTNTNVPAFEPSVAFLCNKPVMHRVVNGWAPDFSTDCINDPDEILEYCRKTYPDHDVKNVVEARYEVHIADWPRFDGPEAGNHSVMPFRCLIEDFESEALLVPQHCLFDHQHDSSKCERPSHWKQLAEDQCRGQQKKLGSSGMLVVCGNDRFRGVEYVCCPEETKAVLPDGHSSSSEADEDEDEYMAYLQGDDKFLAKFSNEHQKFKAAEKSMQRHQNDKVTKMMKAWQEARENVNEMRRNKQKESAEKVNQEITEKFQRLYHAYEDESIAEKKQLVALHQQHVQAMLNKKKRELMQLLKDELETDEPKAAKVLSYLKLFIRTEEKDRLHTVNHYEHLRDTSPEDAIKIRATVLEHLRLITERIMKAIDMLKRVPELDDKIRPEIDDFRHKKFRNIEISADDVVLRPIQVEKPKVEPIYDTIIESSESDDSDEYTDDNYANIRIDDDGLSAEDTNNVPYVAHANSDTAFLHQKSHSAGHAQAYGASNVVGIAIGSVAVFIIIIVAVVVLRKRGKKQPITHGFVEVDPAASPEERHVANMQMNGYENPTYRYFELAQ